MLPGAIGSLSLLVWFLPCSFPPFSFSFNYLHSIMKASFTIPRQATQLLREKFFVHQTQQKPSNVLNELQTCEAEAIVPCVQYHCKICNSSPKSKIKTKEKLPFWQNPLLLQQFNSLLAQSPSLCLLHSASASQMISWSSHHHMNIT